MRLATLRTAAATEPDRGQPRRRVFARADGVAPTLQAALDDWERAGAGAGGAGGAAATARGRCRAAAIAARAGAPLPRAYEWIDGSAYLNHVVLARKARGAEPPDTLVTDPLVYQGGSGVLLGPTDDIPLADPAWGLDFESRSR